MKTEKKNHNLPVIMSISPSKKNIFPLKLHLMNSVQIILIFNIST